jgi:hypothetical protein
MNYSAAGGERIDTSQFFQIWFGGGIERDLNERRVGCRYQFLYYRN